MRLKFQYTSFLKFVSRIPAGRSGGDPERSEGSPGFYSPPLGANMYGISHKIPRCLRGDSFFTTKAHKVLLKGTQSYRQYCI